MAVFRYLQFDHVLLRLSLAGTTHMCRRVHALVDHMYATREVAALFLSLSACFNPSRLVVAAAHSGVR